jgi:transposase
VVGECRARVVWAHSAERLLDKLRARCRACGWRKARGQQRTAATPVLAAISVLNRLALVAATLRAALHALATEAPQWLRALAPPAWSAR